MKRWIAGILAVAVLGTIVVAAPRPAAAGGWHQGSGSSSNFWGGFAVGAITGVVAGAFVPRPIYVTPPVVYQPVPVYVAPPAPVVYQAPPVYATPMYATPMYATPMYATPVYAPAPVCANYWVNGYWYGPNWVGGHWEQACR